MRREHTMPVATWAVVATVWVAAFTGLHAQQAPVASTVLTPVPRLVGFSGVFRPADQLPIAPVETVTVAVYRDRDGGDAVWQETQPVTMTADGRYSLLMGSTLPHGLPLEVFTSGEPRWIGITVQRPGEAEQPRVHLASVPYALKAADADTLGGHPASAYLLADPALSPVSSATTAGTPKDDAPTPSAPSVGTPGSLGMFVDSTTLGNSALVQSGSSIGLGTAAPRDAFHVAVNNGSGALTGYAVQNLSGAAGAYSGMLFYDQNGALGQFQGFNNATHEYRINNVASGGRINFMIGSSSKFLVANNGNIGIGTTNPMATLDLQGGADGGGANDPRAFAFQWRGGGYRHWMRTRHNSILGTNNAIDFFVNNSTSAEGSAGPGTGSTHVMTLDSGNVGIGTLAAAARLHVVTANDTNPGTISAWDSRHVVIGGPASNGSIGMSYDQTNNVGYIEALTPNVAFRSLVLQSGGGNVGIGTASPAERLSVAGTVHSTTGGFKFPDGSMQTTAAAGATHYTTSSDVAFELATFPHDSVLQLINLPVGTYLLSATVQILNAANFFAQDNNRNFRCKFSGEPGVGDASYRYSGSLVGPSVVTTSFHSVLTISSGSVELLCRTFSSAPTSVSVLSRRLTAVAIQGNVVVQ